MRGKFMQHKGIILFYLNDLIDGNKILPKQDFRKITQQQLKKVAEKLYKTKPKKYKITILLEVDGNLKIFAKFVEAKLKSELELWSDVLEVESSLMSKTTKRMKINNEKFIYNEISNDSKICEFIY